MFFIFTQKPLYLDLHPRLIAIKLADFQIHNLTIIFVYQMIQSIFHTLYIVINVGLCGRPQKTFFSFSFFFDEFETDFGIGLYTLTSIATGPVIIVSGRC